MLVRSGRPGPTQAARSRSAARRAARRVKELKIFNQYARWKKPPVTLELFEKLLTKVLQGADAHDPTAVPPDVLGKTLKIFTLADKLTIEDKRTAYGNERGWRQRNGRPYSFRFVTIAASDCTPEEAAKFYKQRANKQVSARRKAQRATALQDQTNRLEEMDMHLERLELVEGTDVRALIKARAAVRDEAIIGQLRLGPKSYSALTAALADEPQYAGMTSERRRRAIFDRVRILRQRGRVEVHHMDGKHGPTAFVRLRKSGL
jgi:hypothetical protein